MEENSRFQSEFSYTKENYKEFAKINQEAHFRNSFAYLVVSFCLIFLIFMLPYGGNAIALLLLSLFWLGLLLFRKIRDRNGGQDYQRLIHSFGDQIPVQRVCVGTFGIRTVNTDTGKEVSDTFDDIRYAMESENLLILVDKLKLCHIIDKRSLEGGSYEALRCYLDENCGKMKKKARRGRFGRTVKICLIVLNIIALLASAAVLLHIPEKLSGQLNNNHSYQEMAQALEACDIRITEQTILEMEEYDAQYALEFGTDYYSDNPYSSKVYDLLYWEGSGIYNEDQWIPSESGIYWLDIEITNLDRMYTDFLTGIAAMAPELKIGDIVEYQNKANWDEGTGIITFQFSLDGTVHEITATVNGDWLDQNALYALGQILSEDSDPQELWYNLDGQGVLLYYGTEAQVKKLEKLTGLDFFDTVR